MTSSDVAAMIERLGKIRHNEIAREAAAMLAQMQREREELREGIKAALNMVEGDGRPPNWDWFRLLLKAQP